MAGEIGRLRAVFESVGADKLKSDIVGVQSSMDKTTSTSQKTSKSTKEASEVLKSLGPIALTAGAALAAGLGAAVAKFAEFDKAMSNVQADTHESAANMALLREAAIDAGAKTAFSATEAANAIDELAKAGVSTTDILGGALDGALNLAAAGSLDVASAAEIAATALSTFKLSGDQMTHVSDLLAAGAGKAQGSVQDMSAALNQSALVAKNTGLSIDDTTGALAAFASNGLLGSDAGTSFKTMLQSLNPRSTQAAQLMDQLGIKAYDAQGNFVGLTKYAGMLQTGLSGLTQEQRNAALQTIFGSDAVRAATVLYEQGSDGIQDWIDKVNDSGYAAETAAAKQDNLSGDLEKLGGAFDTLMISLGEGANGPLRFLTQGATELVDAVNALPGPVKEGATVIGALGAAALIAGGGYVLILPKIAAFKAAQEALNTTAITGSANFKALSATMKTMGIGIGVVAGVGIVIAGVNEAAKGLAATDAQMQNVAKTGKSAEEILTTAWQGYIGSSLWAKGEKNIENFQSQLNNTIELQNNWWSRFWHGTDGTGPFADNLRRVGDTLKDLSSSDLPSAQRAFRLLADETDGSDISLQGLLNAMPSYKEALTQVATNAGKTADDQTLLNIALGNGEWGAAADGADNTSESLDGVQESAEATSEAISDLKDRIEGFGKATLDSRSAQRDFEAALDDAQSALEKNGRTLDIHTEKGRANQAALDDIAESSSKLAQAKLDEGASVEDVSQIVADGRQKYIDMAVAMGMPMDEATRLADTVFVSAESMKASIGAVDAAQIQDKGFEVSDENTIALTEGNLSRLRETINSTPNKEITITEPMSPGIISALKNLGYHVTSLPDGTVHVSASGVDTTSKDIDWAAREREARIKVFLDNVGGTNAPFKNADGNIYAPTKRYAWGGIETHDAQFSIANGLQRLWGEPETGGEAYIPLSPGKRARSLSITEAVAGMFGYDLVPRGTKRVAFADGGTVGAASTSSSKQTLTADLRPIVVNLEMIVNGAKYTSGRALSEALVVDIAQGLKGVLG